MNKFFSIPCTLMVAARNKAEAKRILWAQIQEIESDNLDRACLNAEDYQGIMGVLTGTAAGRVPAGKFEAMYRSTWGDPEDLNSG